MKNLGQGAAPKPQSVDDLPPESNKGNDRTGKGMKGKAWNERKGRNDKNGTESKGNER